MNNNEQQITAHIITFINKEHPSTLTTTHTIDTNKYPKSTNQEPRPHQLPSGVYARTVDMQQRMCRVPGYMGWDHVWTLWVMWSAAGWHGEIVACNTCHVTYKLWWLMESFVSILLGCKVNWNDGCYLTSIGSVHPESHATETPFQIDIWTNSN